MVKEDGRYEINKHWYAHIMVEILFSDLLMEIKTVASSFLFTLLNFYFPTTPMPGKSLGSPFPQRCSPCCCCLFAVCWGGSRHWCSAVLTDWSRGSNCTAQLTQQLEPAEGVDALLPSHFLIQEVAVTHTALNLTAEVPQSFHLARSLLSFPPSAHDYQRFCSV